MKNHLLAAAVISFSLIPFFSFAASPCKLKLTDTKGDFYSADFPEIKKAVEEASEKGFIYRDGFNCEGAELIGRMAFKDQEGASWILKLTVERHRSSSLATVIAVRDEKAYGPQFDFEYSGKPCTFLKQQNPFSLIGLETKSGKWFSAVIDCRKK